MTTFMTKTALIGGAIGLVISATPVLAQGPNHVALPGDTGDTLDALAPIFNDGGLFALRTLGLSVFSTPFNTADGQGDGPFDLDEWEEDPLDFGHRPTLQGNGTFLRVNGLDAQSCNECHVFVDHSTNPPTLGLAGVGGSATNAIIVASLIDVGDSSDDRVSYAPGHDPDLPLDIDGVADFNGRFANPPFLFGGGGVELLGKEMTVELQELLEEALQHPGTPVELETSHGVNFGSITAANGTVDLTDVEGLGVEHLLVEDATIEEAEEVLVVRPFGRKGENFSMRDFDRGAMQFHFGIQPVEVLTLEMELGKDADEDGDGVSRELTVAEMSALHMFDVTNARPRAKLNDRAKTGRSIFRGIGCTDCHMERLETNTRFLPLAYPEVAHNPEANVYFEVDLATEVGDKPNQAFKENGEGGVIVPLFSDLKRHYMGPRLKETFEQAEIANGDFITARLWGIASTEPYLHDGRATTLFEAIEMHGSDNPDPSDLSEAQTQRDAFLNLGAAQQEDLIYFLQQLVTPANPNKLLANALPELLEDLQ